MQELNLTEWRGKISGSEPHILLSNLVGIAYEKALNNDSICANCFTYASSFLEYKTWGRDNLIKLQGAYSKIAVSLTCTETTTAASKFTASSTVVVPEEDLDTSIILRKDTARNSLENNPSKLIVCKEADAELATNEIFEEIGAHKLDDEINANCFQFKCFAK